MSRARQINPNHETESAGGSFYWKQGSGECYNGESNSTTTCDFTNTGLTSDAKNLIDLAVWHTGSNGTEASYDNILTNKFYNLNEVIIQGVFVHIVRIATI